MQTNLSNTNIMFIWSKLINLKTMPEGLEHEKITDHIKSIHSNKVVFISNWYSNGLINFVFTFSHFGLNGTEFQ